MKIREATEDDLEFLAEAIECAELSGTATLSYCTIFGLTRLELRALLREILDENIGGQELCVSGFLVAEIDGQFAGAACSWIEGMGGKASAVIKANLLMHFFGRERISSAAPRLKLMEPLTLPRTIGYLQIESVYVREAFRGRGVCGALLAAHERRFGDRPSGMPGAQIILAKNNALAYGAYERAGFTVVAERISTDPAISTLLPSAARVLMEKRFDVWSTPHRGPADVDVSGRDQ